MSDPADFYLKPAGLLMGTAAANACAAGAGARLAGGPVAFNAVEVIRRSGVTRDIAVSGLGTLRSCRLRDDVDLSTAIDERLRAITASRAPFAGLTLERPRLMGVVNVTPDSFSDGGRYASRDAAVAHGRALMAAGADILDIGGKSTRPGAAPVSIGEELDRVVPVIEALTKDGALVSIDSRRGAVMRAALVAGARIVNDVTALAGDPESLSIVAGSDAAVVLMHMQGEPRTMQQDPAYRDAPLDIYDFFAARLTACAAAGIERARIALDPGIGFGKRDPHNLAILADLALYHGLGCPLLLGASRKALGSEPEGRLPPKERLPTSLAAALHALNQGVQLLRVHDVAETRRVVELWMHLTTGQFS